MGDAGNTNARGIWSDGTTMWVVDLNDEKIYAYDMATKQRDSTKDFNRLNTYSNYDPLSITSDGTTMWVTHRHDDYKIYAYNMPP